MMNDKRTVSSTVNGNPAQLLLIAPAAGLACFIVIELVALGCGSHNVVFDISSTNSLLLLALSVTLAATMLVAQVMLAILKRWRAIRRTIMPVSALPRRQRQEHLCLAGFVVGSASLAAILWMSTTLMAVSPC